MAIDREKVQANAQKFVDKKKYDKAIAELLKITQEEPNDARTLLKIGDLYSKVPDFPNAIATYERVAKLYAQQGFALKAIAVYKQIREMLVKHAPQLESRYAHITPLLADLFQQLGLVSDALAALDEYATTLQRQQKDAEALDVLRRIVELDPSNPLPHLRLAEALSRMKDAEAAVQEFGDAAALLVKLGRRDDAIKVFERLLHLKPDVAFARQCAELYLDRGMGQDGMLALAKLQLCFQADPKNLDTLALLARAFGAIGQANKGIEVQKEMARLAREQGQHDLFQQLIDKLLRIAPNDEQVRAMSMAGSRLSTAGSRASLPPTSAAPDPVIRDAPQETVVTQPARRQVDEPSYQQVDSQEFVDDAEIEEVTEDSIASRRSGKLQAAAVVVQPPPQPPPARPSPARQAPAPAPAPPPTRSAAQDNPHDHNETTRYVPPQQMAADMAFNDETSVERPRAEAPSEPRLEIEEEALVLDDAGSTDEDEEIRAAVGQTLADAASFRRVKLYAKAIESLQTGLELDPMSREVHEALRDILVETGEYAEAAGHVVVISGMQLEAGDVDGAVQALYDALTLRPGMQQAEEMLQSLGYELPSYGDPDPASSAGAGLQPAVQPTQRPDPIHSTGRPPTGDAAYASLDDGPPLPAYPLVDDSPHDGSHDGPPPTSRPNEFTTAEGEVARADDGYGLDAPLPSFPLPGESEPSFELVSAKKTSRPPAGLEGPQTAELEEVLEEADFFASRGLYDDARTVLTEQLALHPRHVLLNERLAELDAQQQAAGDSEAPRGGPVFDRSFDIAASLDAIENLDATGAMASSGFESAGDQIDVEEVFAAFKEGVAKQVSVDDAQSHYDLGVAYKEMGLLDDAIREFEVAARDEKRDCVCRSMVGMIQMERGKIPEAIAAFQRGLAAPMKTEEQEMVLCFEIGVGYEAMSRTKDALSYFQRVAKIDPTYREVTDRIRRLSGRGVSKAATIAAAAADDDFDRAFDDMLDDGKSKTGSS